MNITNQESALISKKKLALTGDILEEITVCGKDLVEVKKIIMEMEKCQTQKR